MFFYLFFFAFSFLFRLVSSHTVSSFPILNARLQVTAPPKSSFLHRVSAVNTQLLFNEHCAEDAHMRVGDASQLGPIAMEHDATARATSTDADERVGVRRCSGYYKK